MPSKTDIILAFDAYGTLLSTESIAQQLAHHFGNEKAPKIAQEWRKQQLEYTWRLNSMEQYEPFSTITRKSLAHALTTFDVSLQDKDTDKLMAAYNTLSLFPDVPPLFPHLEAAPHMHAVIFSNGTADMISATLSQSAEISPHAHLFGKVVVVEPVQRFKPCKAVYEFLCAEVGKSGSGDEVWLVSGNPFDVVGANAAGLRTCWVDREGKGWMDELVDGDMGRPSVIVEGLDGVVEAVEGFLSKL